MLLHERLRKISQISEHFVSLFQVPYCYQPICQSLWKSQHEIHLHLMSIWSYWTGGHCRELSLANDNGESLVLWRAIVMCLEQRTNMVDVCRYGSLFHKAPRVWNDSHGYLAPHILCNRQSSCNKKKVKIKILTVLLEAVYCSYYM